MNVFDLDLSEEDNDDENVIIQKEATKMITVKDLRWTQCLINEVAAIFQNTDLCCKHKSCPVYSKGRYYFHLCTRSTPTH